MTKRSEFAALSTCVIAFLACTASETTPGDAGNSDSGSPGGAPDACAQTCATAASCPGYSGCYQAPYMCDGTCHDAACTNGCCEVMNDPAGTNAGPEGVCDGEGNDVDCLVDADCGAFIGEELCNDATCQAKRCVWTPLPDGTPCRHSSSGTCKSGECMN